VVCAPCFSEYQDRAAEYRKPVLAIPLDGDFRVSAKLLEHHIQAHDVIVLGNPNNPTGRRITRQELLKISQLVAKRHAFLVLDEAFLNFALMIMTVSVYCMGRSMCALSEPPPNFSGFPVCDWGMVTQFPPLPAIFIRRHSPGG
jgi:bifunctional pyridoxal-dependent enzyme with beta-cystathionase and maltose regulon repressor activities